MTELNSATSQTIENELVITRVYDAPRQVVFKAWTDAKQLAQWWGPRMFDNPVCEVDPQPGGRILIHMRGPDGTVFPEKGVYEEVVEPERLVFTDGALEDERGEFQMEGRTIVTFEDLDGKTRLTVRAAILKATPAAMGALSGMEQGWNESLDKLAEFLAG